MAALCCEVWQKRKRSSFRPVVKAYLEDMVLGYADEEERRGKEMYKATPQRKRSR